MNNKLEEQVMILEKIAQLDKQIEVVEERLKEGKNVQKLLSMKGFLETRKLYYARILQQQAGSVLIDKQLGIR